MTDVKDKNPIIIKSPIIYIMLNRGCDNKGIFDKIRK